MSASPSSSLSQSSSSDDEEIEKIEAITKFSKSMPDERLDCPTFQREDESDPRVMVERPAGSNEWYQYYYEIESYNEIKLRSPATRKTSEYIEWIDKNSSRLSRIGLSGKLWKYIKGTDGAWMPRGTEDKRQHNNQETKKTSKKAGKGRKRNHTSASGGVDDASDQGNAVDDSVKNGANRKTSKSRLGTKSSMKAGKGKINAKSDTKNNKNKDGGSSSSGMDTEEEREYDRNKASMGCLAEWFLKHNNALTLKLPGTAESAGLEHIIKKQKSNGVGGDGNGNGDRKKEIGAAGDLPSLGKLPSGHTMLNKGKSEKPSAPKIIKNAAPLEEDDLFGGGGGKSLSRKPSGASGLLSAGSGQMAPMNSLPLPVKKESKKIVGGIPSRLGGGGGGIQQQVGFSVKPSGTVAGGGISPGSKPINKDGVSPTRIATGTGLQHQLSKKASGSIGGGAGSPHKLYRIESGDSSQHGHVAEKDVHRND